MPEDERQSGAGGRGGQPPQQGGQAQTPPQQGGQPQNSPQQGPGQPRQQGPGQPRSTTPRGGEGQFDRFREMVRWPESIAAGAVAWFVGLGLTYAVMWATDLVDEIEENTLDHVVVIFFESFGGSITTEEGAGVDAEEAGIDAFLTVGGYSTLDTDWFGLGPFVHALVPLLVLVPVGYVIASRHIENGDTGRPAETILAGVTTSIPIVVLFVLSILIVDVPGASVDGVEVFFVTLMYSVVFTAIGATIRSSAGLSSGLGFVSGVGAFLLGFLVWVFIDDPFGDGLLVGSIADYAEAGDAPPNSWELVTVDALEEIFGGLFGEFFEETPGEDMPYTVAEGFSDLSGAFDHFYVLSGFVSRHGREPGAIFPEWVVILVPLLIGAGLAYFYEAEDPLTGLGEGARLGVGYVITVTIVTILYVITEIQALESTFDDWPRDPVDTIEEINVIVGTAGGDIIVGGIVYPVVFAAIGGALGAFAYKTRNKQTAGNSRRQPRDEQYRQAPTGQQPPQEPVDQQPPAGGYQEPVDQQPPTEGYQEPVDQQPPGQQPPGEPTDYDQPPADEERPPAGDRAGEAPDEELSPEDIVDDPGGDEELSPEDIVDEDREGDENERN